MRTFLLILALFTFTACGDSHRVNDPGSLTRNEEATADCKMHLKTENLCLKATWDSMPTESTFGSMTLTFTDKNTPERIISPRHEPSMLLWMPSMGHGSSPVTITLIEDGIYKANDIFFIMPGPWEIRYQLKDGDKVVEEIIQEITI